MYGLELTTLTDDLLAEIRDIAPVEDPRHALVKKIRDSMLEIGKKQPSWQEVVEAYKCMRTFSLDGRSDFQVRIDHITDSDGWGKSKYARISIDGAFAFYLFCRN